MAPSFELAEIIQKIKKYRQYLQDKKERRKHTRRFLAFIKSLRNNLQKMNNLQIYRMMKSTGTICLKWL